MSSVIVRAKYQRSKTLRQTISKSISYISDKRKADSTCIDKNDLLNEYVSASTLYEDNESFTWNMDGDINAKKELKKIDLNSNHLWSLVVSFKPDFAINNGLISKSDYYQLTTNIMPNLLVNMGLDLNNVSWYATLHRNTNNPHLHIIFFEHNKTIDNAQIPSSSLSKFKSDIVNYLIDNEKFYRLRDQEFNNITKSISLKNLNEVKNQKLFSDSYRKELNKMLLDFYNKLPQKGRLQYNSKNFVPYKKDLDNIINYILMHDSVKYSYAKYIRLLSEHQKELSEIYGNSKSNYYDNQLNKLYSKIGNEILYNYKVYSSQDVLERELNFLSKNITKMNLKSRDYAKKETKIEIAKQLFKICMLSKLNYNQTKKVLNDWNNNSHYDFNIDELMLLVNTMDYKMNSNELYDTLKKIGYDYTRYSKLKEKDFYRELNYKIFINKAVNHLMYELEREEKEIINQIEYELEI